MFSIKALGNILSEALVSNSLVVVAGHPGAGKTAIASTICYSNTLKGLKCLYISFQEDKEKLFSIMKSLDIDFSTLEE